MNGILNVYKEKGYTSHDVVAKLRGILHMKKIGHTGTLDPDAVGVLPVCVGKATKVCELLTNRDKTYEAAVRLGVITDTLDLSGRIREEREVAVSCEELQAALSCFRGEILQIPPMYSAVKVNGKRLYELARKGEEVERKERKVTIFQLELMGLDLDRKEFSIRVRCSKGTYIRSLCHDIGQKLGCGAAMKSLVRIRVGQFSIEEAKTLAEIADFCRGQDPMALLQPIDSVFSDYSSCHVEEAAMNRLRNGNLLSVRDCRMGSDAGSSGRKRTPGIGIPLQTEADGSRAGTAPADGERVRVYGSDGEFYAIYRFEKREQRFRVVKMFR